jgi:hypothetical protein
LIAHNGVEYPTDVEGIRDRIRKMDHVALLRYGTPARYMCSPEANLAHTPREEFVLQLNSFSYRIEGPFGGTNFGDGSAGIQSLSLDTETQAWAEDNQGDCCAYRWESG